VATQLAAGAFVVRRRTAEQTARASAVVGYIKSHRVIYLRSSRTVVAELAPGQRTPTVHRSRSDRPTCAVLVIRAPCDAAGGHSWTGIVRCEGVRPAAEGRCQADGRSDRRVLPIVGSNRTSTPARRRNLVPIGALERELRHRMAIRVWSIAPSASPSANGQVS